MRGFRSLGGWYVAGLGPTEREVFATVVADVAELLGAERFGTRVDGAAHADAVASGPLDQVRMSTGAVDAPEDPAVRRLLPDASRDDGAVTAEFRRLTEADLRSTKVARLRAVWTALVDAEGGSARPGAPGAAGGAGARGPRPAVDDDDDLVLSPADAPAFAAALTDVRLVLGERLGLETEEDADRLFEALEEQAAAEEEAEEAARSGRGRADDDRPAREILEREVRAYLGSVYAALSWLQESLMAVLLDDLGPGVDQRPSRAD